MPGHDLVVVGASAGGVEALRTLVSDLPANFPAAVCVVLHIPPSGRSMLPVILERAGRLPVTHPADGANLEPGHIYVAPPDCHLLVEPGHVRVVRGPRENRARPAVDPLFRSAAQAYGPRVVGVILTGALDDGTAGLLAIKQCGGIAVVQDPDEAQYTGMPRSAMDHVAVDHCVSIEALGALLVRLAQEPVQAGEFSVPLAVAVETRIAVRESGTMEENSMVGAPSAFACPECHGTLWQLHDGELMRFRCRTGHAYSAESMLAEHSEMLEAALWSALRALEESADLTRRLEMQARERHQDRVAERYSERAQEREAHAVVLRDLLHNTSLVQATG